MIINTKTNEKVNNESQKRSRDLSKRSTYYPKIQTVKKKRFKKMHNLEIYCRELVSTKQMPQPDGELEMVVVT